MYRLQFPDAKLGFFPIEKARGRYGALGARQGFLARLGHAWATLGPRLGVIHGSWLRMEVCRGVRVCPFYSSRGFGGCRQREESLVDCGSVEEQTLVVRSHPVFEQAKFPDAKLGFFNFTKSECLP